MGLKWANDPPADLKIYGVKWGVGEALFPISAHGSHVVMWESSCHCMGLKLGTQERAADVQLLVIVAKGETFVRAAVELWSFFPSS